MSRPVTLRPLPPQLLVCPSCRYDGGSEPAHGGPEPFRYLEDIVCHRAVAAVASEGVALAIWIDGSRVYETGEGYDQGSNARLECRNCLAEFPLPAPSIVDWALDDDELDEAVGCPCLQRGA